MKKIDTDMKLTRDPRYVAARNRLAELQLELNELDNKRNEVQSGLSSHTSNQELIALEAHSMLAGEEVVVPTSRNTLSKTLSEVTHRIAVLRQAIEIQRKVVDGLRHEIGKEISTELLPVHKENVSKVIQAAIQLSVALQAESAVRDELIENDIPFTSVIRPMGIKGFDFSDDQSNISRYLLEAYEYGYINERELPEIVRDRVSAK